MSGELNMGGNRVSHLLDPVYNEDAVTKTYLDTSLESIVKTTNNSENLFGHRVAIFSIDSDRNSYVYGSDVQLVNSSIFGLQTLAATPQTLGRISIGDEIVIRGLAGPTQADHAANKEYVDHHQLVYDVYRVVISSGNNTLDVSYIGGTGTFGSSR